MSKLIVAAKDAAEHRIKQGIDRDNSNNDREVELQNKLDKLKLAVLDEVRQLNDQEITNGKLQFSTEKLGYLSLDGGFGAVFFVNGSTSKCIVELGAVLETKKFKAACAGDNAVGLVSRTEPVVRVKVLSPNNKSIMLETTNDEQSLDKFFGSLGRALSEWV